MERKHLLLGVTGSVAAIKTPELVHQLTQLGFDVRLVLTENAARFIDLTQLSVPVYRDADEWSWSNRGDPVLHIELRNWADVLVLAPLSANTLAKLANGLADNLLSTVARSWYFPESTQRKHVLFAPAMNHLMWQHPITMEHINRLTLTFGWILIPPIPKVLICGEQGIGAMAEIADICSTVTTQLHESQ
ncbi:unnamed protein product [Dicrocoelium dendriticum]|nr:unnamed protein product [Dicrocoelium dendriticum]